MKTIDEIQTEFVTAFNEIDDWMMQYEFLLQSLQLPLLCFRIRKRKILPVQRCGISRIQI